MNVNRIKLSIIVPVYNAVGTIEKALLSVLEQNIVNAELVVIDGNSSDGTLEILKHLEPQLSYLSSAPDGGVYDAINKGIAAARGDWFYVLGSDDEMLPVLARTVAALDQSSTVYYGDVLLVSSRKRYGGVFNQFKLLRQNIPHQAMFFPRQLFAGRAYDLRYPILADYAFNLSCFNDPKVRFKYLDYAVALYNDVSGLSSTTRDFAFSRDKPAIVKAHYSRVLYAVYMMYRRLLSKTGT